MPYLLRSQSGGVIAEIRNRILYRRFRGSKHLLRKPPALAIEKAPYLQARELFDRLEWRDVESERTYTCDAKHFDRYAFEIQRGGYPPQLALPLRYWQVHDPQAQGQLSIQEV